MASVLTDSWFDIYRAYSTLTGEIRLARALRSLELCWRNFN